MRKASTLIIVILFGSLMFSLLAGSDIGTVKEFSEQTDFTISSDTVIWQHDCSNTTAFDRSADESWLYASNSEIVGSIATSSEYIYADDYGTGTQTHGPFQYLELEDPFPISNLVNFSVELEIDHSTVSGMGGGGVWLFDETNTTIANLQVQDSWSAVAEVRPYCHWAYDNDNVVGTPSTYPTYMTSLPYRETLTLFQNTTGFYADLPMIGVFLVTVSGDVDGDRLVRYVGINLRASATSPELDILRVYDISLVYDTVVPSEVLWHHDCSNLTSFSGIADDAWYGDPNVNIDGSMASSGDYIYPTSLGTGSNSHGPMQYYTFPTSILLSQLVELEADIEVNAASATAIGAAAIVLFDENNDTVIAMNVADSWGSQDDVNALASIYLRNGSSYNTPYTWPTWAAQEPYREVLRVFQDDEGFWGEMPRIGTFLLLESDQVEMNRQVKNIAINFRSYASDPACDPMRIYDINFTHTPLEMYKWNDDGTSIDGWKYHTEWDGYTRWATASGTLASDNGYLHVPQNSGYATGPFWFKEFDDTINLSEFGSWIIKDEANQPSQSYKGNLWVGLFDENKQRIFSIGVYSWDELEHAIHIYSWYTFENGSSVAYYVTDMDPDFFGNISIYYEQGTGLMGHIETEGSGLILDEDLWVAEPTRQISYIGVQWRKGTGTYLDHRLHDIEITSLSQLTTDTSSIGISVLDDVILEAGVIGESLTWSVENFTPVSYEVYRNSSLLSSGIWSGDVTVSLNNLHPGTYEYTATIYGPNDVVVTDTVMVSVIDSTAPSITHPINKYNELGSTGNTITWSVSDLYPDEYELYKNNVLFETGNWDGLDISTSTDGLDLGEYDYKLVVRDEYDNEAYDIVSVDVSDTTAPTVSHPIDLEIDFGVSNATIEWSIYDLRPDSFELFRDGSLVAEGSWDNSVDIEHTIPSTLATGTYEYTLIVEDTSGNTRTDTVIVYVLNPSIGGFDFLTIGITIGGIAVIIIIGGALVCKRGSDAAIGGDFAYG